MGPEGFEPSTNGLKGRYSTAELQAHKTFILPAKRYIPVGFSRSRRGSGKIDPT